MCVCFSSWFFSFSNTIKFLATLDLRDSFGQKVGVRRSGSNTALHALVPSPPSWSTALPSGREMTSSRLGNCIRSVSGREADEKKEQSPRKDGGNSRCCFNNCLFMKLFLVPAVLEGRVY